MKFSVIVKGHKEVAEKVHKDVKRRAYNIFNRAGIEIVSIARRRYLSGGYPEHLRVDTGNLRAGIFYAVEQEGDNIFLKLCIPELTRYGRYWEAVHEFSHRQNEMFSNGTPKARPFFTPAIRDYWPKLIEKFRRLV